MFEVVDLTVYLTHELRIDRATGFVCLCGAMMPLGIESGWFRIQ